MLEARLAARFAILTRDQVRGAFYQVLSRFPFSLPVNQYGIQSERFANAEDDTINIR